MMATRQSNVRTYEATGRGDFLSLAGTMLDDLRTALPLALELARRDLKAQYRSAALGMLWSLIVPAFTVAIWLFIRASGAIEIRGSGDSYAVFLVTGSLLWAIFVDAANAPLQQVQGAGSMLTKMAFPREALVLSGIYQACFGAVIKLAILIVALLILGNEISASAVLLPLAALALIGIGTLLGVAITPIGAMFSDVGRAMPLALQSLMFLAPVVYATPRTGWASQIIEANPITPLIEFGRSAAVGGQLVHAQDALLVTCATLLALAVAWVMFRAAMPVIIERLGG